MNRVAYKRNSASSANQAFLYRLQNIKQFDGYVNSAVDRIKDLISSLGYLLTVATSLGLWFGIYGAVSVILPGKFLLL